MAPEGDLEPDIFGQPIDAFCQRSRVVSLLGSTNRKDKFEWQDMAQPFSISVFVPTGVPSEVRVVEKMNWTGRVHEISRDSWPDYRAHEDLLGAGIYFLIGYDDESGDDSRPALYIGESDSIGDRLESHYKQRDFWDRALVFVSSNSGLNKANVKWLEWKTIELARMAGRSYLLNTVTPKEPTLSAAQAADAKIFLSEMTSVLPLLGCELLEPPRKFKVDVTPQQFDVLDTVIVPANQEGFEKVFLGENCWHAIRIGGGNIRKLKYIAAYQTAPVSAVTHYAEIESIEPYGDGEKYQLNFKSPAQAIGPVTKGDARPGVMQSPRYASFRRLNAARQLEDIW